MDELDNDYIEEDPAMVFHPEDYEKQDDDLLPDEFNFSDILPDKSEIWPSEGTYENQVLWSAGIAWILMGWNVIPLLPDHKKPYKDFPARLYFEKNRKRVTECQLARWAIEYPGANPGLLLDSGPFPIVVIDVDNIARADWVIKTFGKPLLIVASGRKDCGFHFYYRGDPDNPPHPATSAVGPESDIVWSSCIDPSTGEVTPFPKWGLSEIDLKCWHGYVLAAGAIHPKTHNPYRAKTVKDVPITIEYLENLTVFPADKWEAEKAKFKAIHERHKEELQSFQNKLTSSRTKEVEGDTCNSTNIDIMTEFAYEGNRNATLTSHAGKLRSRGASVTEIETALVEINRSNCSPSLHDDEVKRIAASVGRYPQGRTDSNYSFTPVPWEQPIPFDELDLPSFPANCLPNWLELKVKSEAEFTQTPLDLAGMLALSAVAISCSKKYIVEVRHNHEEPLNLFLTIAMDPGSRKSAVFKSMLKPIYDYEKEECLNSAVDIEKAKALKRIAVERQKRLETGVATAKEADRKKLMDEVIQLSQDIANMVIPPEPRLLCDDVTPEALASILAEQGGKIALASAEGGIFGMMAGRYSSNGQPNLDVFLKGHSGDDLRVDRKGRPAEFVSNPCLNVCLAVQPAVLNNLADVPGFRGRGLLARFLYALPVSNMGYRKIGVPSYLEATNTLYVKFISLLLKSPKFPEPKVLTISPLGYARILEFEGWLEPQLQPAAKLSGITDWAGKLYGTVPRIAALLHLADNVEVPEPWFDPIELETVERAIVIVKYLIEHAQAAFNLMAADPVMQDAKLLLAWIRRTRTNTFQKNDAHRAMYNRFKRMEKLEQAIKVLEERHFIRQLPPTMKAVPGRPPSPTYEINIHNPTDYIDTNDRNQVFGTQPAEVTPSQSPAPTDYIDNIDKNAKPELNSVNIVNIVNGVSSPAPEMPTDAKPVDVTIYSNQTGPIKGDNKPVYNRPETPDQIFPEGCLDS